VVSLTAGSGGSPAMKNPERPAACLRAGPNASAPALTRQRQAIAESAQGRPGSGPPALATLSAAIGAGRHDAVLVISPCAIGGLHPGLMSLLVSCTRPAAAGSSLPRQQLQVPQPAAGH